MNYGKALKIARALAGFKQKELARRADIDPSHISLIEMGKRQPSAPALQKLSKALSMPPYLLTLLATERDDLNINNPEELRRIAEQLTRLLLQVPCAGSGSRGKRSISK